MYVSRSKRVFVATAVLAMLAAQTQSCSSNSGGESANGGSLSGGVPSAGGSVNVNGGSNGAGGGAVGTGGAATGGALATGGAPSAGAAGRATTGGAGGVAAAGGGNGGAAVAPAGQSAVSVVQSSKANASDVTLDDIRAMVTEAVSLAGGLADIVHDNQTVVIKPNLVTTGTGDLAAEVNGVTADWRIAKVVAELVRKLDPNGKILVMEGSVNSTADSYKQFKYTKENIPEVDEFIALETTGTFGDRNAPALMQVSVPDGKFKTSYYVNKRYYQADVVISIPVLKTHLNAAVTGAVKNLAIGATPASVYGMSATNPTRNQTSSENAAGSLPVPHKGVEMHQFIHDYYRLKPANFSVMDGLQAVQNGPYPGWTGGNMATDRMNMRLILASRDAVALDTIETLIVGWDPKTIPYLGLLDGSKVGTADPGKILVLGKRVDEVRKKFAGGSQLAVATCAPISDAAAPQFTVSTHSVNAGVLSLSLQGDADLYKVEVYAGGTLLGSSISKDFANIQIDVKSLSPQTYDLKVIGYDYYLNATQVAVGSMNLP